MKKTLIQAVFILVALSALNSCSSAKGTTMKNPCTENSKDKNVKRANANASSPDLAMSSQMALVEAKSTLAQLIASDMKEVSETYKKQRNMAGTEEFDSKFESTVRDVVSETLRDISIVCEETTKTTKQRENGTNYDSYTTWMSIEISRETIYNGINSSLSNDEKLRQDYDAAKFREVFNEEINKLEKEQP